MGSLGDDDKIRQNSWRQSMENNVIVVTSGKGGVGKTTTTINLAAALAVHGKKVLIIDTDPQGNATSGFGVDKNDLENTLYELMLGECSVKDCLLEEVVKNVSIIPANVNLAGAEIELIGVEEKEYILKKHIETIKKDYDYIVVDNVPAQVVADAGIVNRVADVTLYVIREGKIDRRYLPELQRLYEEKKFNHLCIIINDSKMEQKRYGYGNYGYGRYGYSYGYGYGEVKS